MKIRASVFSILLIISVTFVTTGFAAPQAREHRVSSPDGRTTATLRVGDALTIAVSHADRELVTISSISMNLEPHTVLGDHPTILRSTPRSVNETITPVVAEKRKAVPDVFRELFVEFVGNYGLKIRVYNDAVAYRFVTRLPGEITVGSETLAFQFAPDDSVWFPEEKSFLSHSERIYKFLALKEIADTQMCCIPAVVAKASGVKVALAESDLLDYPGLYLHGSGGGRATLESKFPPYPLEERLVGDRTMKVSSAAPFIAKTRGTREFPWRVVAIAEKDGDLIGNDIIYRLGSPLKLKETSWIKPGKVAWDWWNANNLHGVGFKSGINTETYKYYIDFASRNHLEYVIFDEGWSKPSDLFEINPQMDMDALFSYAEQRNVGIILWVTSKALDDRMTEALDRFHRWGAKGIKVDFMQRDDQKMVNFYEKTAIEAAKRHLLVDFHGAYKPTGFNRAYPHVITREGVLGLEHNKWSSDVTPQHDVTLPFTRMFAGAMDFTPGAMRNATKENFRPIFTEPMSQGTRCHQLAMYVVFESPLQMLSDSPSSYEREKEAMEFLSVVPTTWDRTEVLNGAISRYVTVARQHGKDWFIGSMTDWSPRDFQINLSFLGAGSFRMTDYSDGINADKYAADYTKNTKVVTSSDVLKVHLAPGGGWAARIERVD